MGPSQQRRVALEPVDIAKKIVEVASDKQAADIVLLDIGKVCTFADYFVICTGETNRQIDAITKDLDEALGKAGAPLLRREGAPESGWILLDFGPVIVHIFGPEERAFYQLEQLWSKGTLVVKIE